MATWHFRFHLVPRAGILLYYEELPEILRGFSLPPDDSFLLANEEDSPDYWKGTLDQEEIGRKFAGFMSARETRSKGVLRFGSDDGNRVTVWGNDISVAIDMRKVDLSLIVDILDIGRELDCMVVVIPTDRVVPPQLSALLAEMRDSIAFRFCDDPIGTLKKLAEERGLV